MRHLLRFSNFTGALRHRIVSDMHDFTTDIHGRWPDMDQNGHMRTTAFLGAAEDARVLYFASRGFPMEKLQAIGVGPVVQRDELTYRAELRLSERADIRLELAGLSPDGARFRLRNTIVRHDGVLAATVTSSGGWMDLVERRLTVPPFELADALASLTRTDDFEELRALAPR